MFLQWHNKQDNDQEDDHLWDLLPVIKFIYPLLTSLVNMLHVYVRLKFFVIFGEYPTSSMFFFSNKPSSHFPNKKSNLPKQSAVCRLQLWWFLVYSSLCKIKLQMENMRVVEMFDQLAVWLWRFYSMMTCPSRPSSNMCLSPVRRSNSRRRKPNIRSVTRNIYNQNAGIIYYI